jgi:hypothetical protein
MGRAPGRYAARFFTRDGSAITESAKAHQLCVFAWVYASRLFRFNNLRNYQKEVLFLQPLGVSLRATVEAVPSLVSASTAENSKDSMSNNAYVVSIFNFTASFESRRAPGPVPMCPVLNRQRRCLSAQFQQVL